ncbi:MAG: LysM peptidoglycan-binding domain-containing protein [Anaerolineales bacterium]|nr:LysM peptidoglycan-binding domain-containing protein [Anaerolineales bacterium]
MTPQTRVPYLKYPQFKAAMTHFQNGEWGAGLSALDEVQKEFPGSADLEAIRRDILMKTQFELDEVLDQKEERKKTLRRNGVRLALLGVALVIVFLGVQTFSSWIFDQWTNIQQGVTLDFRSVELAIKYRDAQSYLLAKQPESALGIIQEISDSDPTYPGLEILLEEAKEMQALETRYAEALQSLEQGDTLTALEQLDAIDREKPNFQDVSIKIQEIQGDLVLLDLFNQAEKAYEEQDWASATAQYETLRAIAPNYRSDLMEQRLIRSYMNLASDILEAEDESPETLAVAESYFRKVLVLNPRDEALLVEQNRIKEQFNQRLFDYYIQAAREAVVGQEDSLNALKIANNYLNNALRLRPKDPNVLLEINLANAYLQAQIDFEAEQINRAITNLEFIYSNDPGYANGTALQTLYESYMLRGDIFSATGELEPALSDYQSATEVALKTSNPVLKLYFAKIKIAETMGTLNNFAVAVNNYSEAVELVNLEPLLDAEDTELAYLLREAIRYAEIEWYRTSYRLYRRVLPATHLILDKEEVVTIKEGDYLSSLAKIYDTTVQEILQANALPSAGNIQLGQELVIPTLKVIDE